MSSLSPNSSFEMVDDGVDGTKPDIGEVELDCQTRAETLALGYVVAPLQTAESENHDSCEDDFDEGGDESSEVDNEKEGREDKIDKLLKELEETKIALEKEKEDHRKTAAELYCSEIAVYNANIENSELKLKVQVMEKRDERLQTEKRAQNQRLIEMEDKLELSAMNYKRLEVLDDRLIRDFKDLREEMDALRQRESQELMQIEDLHHTNKELIEENRLLRYENRDRIEERKELKNKLKKANNHNSELSQYYAGIEKECKKLDEKLKKSSETEKTLRNARSELLGECFHFQKECLDLGKKQEKLVKKNQVLHQRLIQEIGQRFQFHNQVLVLEKENSGLIKMVTDLKATLDLKNSESLAQRQDEEKNQLNSKNTQ